MKAALLLLLALAAALPAPAAVLRVRNGSPEAKASSAAGSEPVLRWRNGESLTGELVSATEEAVTWKSPAFDDPLVVGWPALKQLEQRLPAAAGPEPFLFLLRDGSLLTGELTSLSAEGVGLRSARHGEVLLRRSEVLSVRRRQSDSLLFSGPVGDVGWRPVMLGSAGQPPEEMTAQKVAPLREGAAGSLSLPFWNRGAVLDLKLPEKVEVELRVSSRERPDFALWLEGNGPAGPRIETWEGELVLVAGAKFRRLRALGAEERSVSLRLCCDRKAHTCSAWTPEGEKLADWSYSADALGPAGIVLQSKGRELTLEYLRVRRWSGAPPARIDPRAPRVELADGRTFAGAVTSASADWLTMRPAGAEGEASFAFAEVEALVFSGDAPRVEPVPATLLYADGTLIRGRLRGLQSGEARVQTAFAAEPVASQLKDLRQLIVESKAAAAEKPLAELDVLEFGDVTLHGRLSGAEDGAARWLPVGGVGPARPSVQTGAVISRALPPGEAIPGAPALFYTTGGDVLPGRLRALDETGVDFESSLVSLTRFPPGLLQAIQFGSAGQSGIKGFNDPGWRVLKGNAKSAQCGTDGVLHLAADTSYGHPSAMQGAEVQMAFGTQSFDTVRLRMFCAGTDPAKSINLILQHYSDRITLGLESTEGQLENQFQVRSSSSPVPLRLLITESTVEVQIDGTAVRRFPIEQSKRAGAGLIVEPAGLWGNRVSAVTLSAFSAPPSPGRTWLPEIGAQAKTEALTVPRFRKDRPPRQALIAANGDVLRGEIVAATATHFEFRSGLEELRVPQDRVRAAIWLKKPSPAAAAAPAVAPAIDAVRKRLLQPMDRNFGMSNAGLSTAVSLLQQEAGDLKFRLPEEPDRRRFRIQFGNETIGEALEKLCEMAGCHYRIDETGTIVLEAVVRATPQFARRVYWLRPGAFAEAADLKALLLAKGIAFPPGTAVEWRPAGNQLVMANTPAAHEKLAALLIADFGGSLGSPTHWLLLASGARLALAVEKFGAASIVGRHPVYGRCEVPLRDIYRIHTSEPPPTTVMTALSDWRLVDAPEPVLPEGGGESSPLLGQIAKPFKLALLGGGEFELAKQKGKVVVLDFWATWCGPCIKSLPGLIEAMKPFPADKVAFVGLNQGEAPAPVEQFLEAREWKFPVAFDTAQSVAQQYGVDGIPYTVIIAPDGKVAYVKTGYSPDGDQEIAGVVQKLLTPAPPAPAAPTGASPAPSADLHGAQPEPRG